MKLSAPRSRHVLRTVLPAAILALAGVAFAQHASPTPPHRIQMRPEQPILPASPIDPDTVYLAVGRIATPQNVPSVDLRTAVAQARPHQRFIIQLDGPMTPARRQALKDAGIRLHDYIPSDAYIAELDGGNPDKAASLGFVQWQAAFQTAWKLAPDLGQRQYATAVRQQMQANGREALIVTLFAGEDAKTTRDAIFNVAPTAAVYYASDLNGQGQISVSVDRGDVEKVAALDAVQFVEDAPELTFRNATTRWIAQSNIPNMNTIYAQGIHGEGQIVGVIDGKPDQNHCSLDGGKILFYNTTPGADTHGTHTSCTAVGDDGSGDDSDNLRGIAWAGNMVFDDIPSFTDAAMYATLEQHQGQGARVHTNSWGDDGTTSYNSLCRGIDRFSYDYEDNLVCFAETNTSTLKNPENAKNLLAVGASQDTPNQDFLCSGGIGPTADGRRKPEIFLPGCNTTSALAGSACSTIQLTGTSMASPAVTGSAALVRQYYVDGFYPSGMANSADSLTPTGALIKATVLNSSVDMTGISGYPSDQEGWGRVLLDSALFFVGDPGGMFAEDVRNANGLSTGQFNEYTINVVGSSPRLKITLVWTDPPASASTGTGPAWVNDLNLEVVGPGGTYLGNVFSGGQSVTGGVADDKNNVEMVILNSPPAGAYTLRVTGAAVNVGTQGYALVASGDISLGPAPLNMSITSAIPDLEDLNVSTPVNVHVNLNDDTLLSLDLHYSDNAGSTYTTVAMSDDGGGDYSATIPGYTSCSDQPAFYVSAEGTLAGTISLPFGGASSPYTFPLGVESVAFSDDMETDMGWSVNPDAADTATTGQWERADPEGTAAQPEDDHTPDPGTLCWVTGATAGASVGINDVDGGFTTLETPAIDLSSYPAATIGYWRWYSNDAGAAPNTDIFTVQVSDDNGGSWTTVETVGPTGPETSGGWNYHEFDVGSLVSLTSQVRVRFIADDSGTGSIVEAAIDDFSVTSVQCTETPPACSGDLNGDGRTDVTDFGILASNFGTTGLPPNTGGDLNGDGAVNVLDFSIFASNFGCGTLP